MGRPKYLLEIGGRTFLECCLDALHGVVDRIVVSIAAGQAVPTLDSSVLIVEDKEPEGGPLVGLASAVPAAGAIHSVVLSCDAPLIKQGLIELLFDAIGSNDAALPTAFGKEQFFPAAYYSSVGEIARRLLKRNERRMSALAAECNCSVVAESRVLEMDPNLESFFNVNAPSDYEALVRRFENV